VRLAFFWVGSETRIPEALVASARRVYGPILDIVQLTDKHTPDVVGVSRVQRSELSPFIMVARLQAYAALDASDDFTMFCDADSLVIAQFKLPELDKNLLLTPRVHDGLINANFPEHYPEFQGKTLGSVMPYMFGAIAARRDHTPFRRMVEICESLPARFHRWYGDQVSLKIMIDTYRPEFGLLDPSRHLCIIRSDFDRNLLLSLLASDVQLLTFKGPAAKPALFSWWNGIKSSE
jgi:hypothetical protein